MMLRTVTGWGLLGCSVVHVEAMIEGERCELYCRTNTEASTSTRFKRRDGDQHILEDFTFDYKASLE